ncbi:MAG: HAD family hydrolase [Candidatus Bathyarchaeota archaeon]|nr:HAD family hydrolase [Candidatus Bathyarchaeota archaeon]MDH5732522.1 HAD family hydrolase [Candidatus Bathyarchaeota archaeon]
MESKSQVKAVLFDLGGTLVKTAEIPPVMKRILRDCGIDRSLEEISQAWRKVDEKLNFRDLPELLDEFWVQWNVRILRTLQVNSDTRRLAEFIATHWWDYSDVTLYPDAERMLLLLKEKGLKIGIVTNGLQSDVDEILPKVGLQDFFDIVVVIDTLRKMKPDVEVFRYALQKLEAVPSEAIFVGDEIEADYKGAKGAGLTVYLVDRDRRVQDESVHKISSLEDLFELTNIG